MLLDEYVEPDVIQPQRRTERKLDVGPLPTITAMITSCNILEVEAGKLRGDGGDAGHGGRIYLRLKDLGATAWEFRVLDYQEEAYRFDFPKQVEIVLGGDTEIETFTEALRVALEEYSRGREDPE